MTEQLADLLDKLPAYLGGHMLVSASALLVGLLISVPLGIAVTRGPRWIREVVLGLAGVIQTVPSLALLALMVLLLGGLIGFWPAFIALTLYSLLPILINTILGIEGVDPNLTEAAKGLGMSDGQLLWRVQLPLALPILIGGIRTATVLVVGTATLVTPVGGICLGNYIFGGLESMNPTSTVFGCVIAAGLAVGMDQLVRLLEVAAKRRSRVLGIAAILGLALVFGAGLASPISRFLGNSLPPAIIASGPFTEQHILNEVLGRQAARAGFRVDSRPGMSEGIQMEALRHGQIDCMVNYSGNLWTLLMKRQDFLDRESTLAEITTFMERDSGVLCLGSLGFENAYAFAMTRSVARHSGVESLESLALYARRRANEGKKLRVGADNQFFTRPEWKRVKEIYSLREEDVETIAMDPTLLCGAARDGQLDVAVAYSTDGRIPAFDLTLLTDPRGALPPYDAVLLVSAKAAQKPGFVEAIRPLIGAISLATMQKANHRVDQENRTARQAAEELFASVHRQDP